MSRDIWVTADPHYGHEKIIEYGERPFSSLEEMDQTLVERHNEVVKDGDIIYMVGDIYFGQGWKHLPNLKGRKRLIIGNHDDGKDKRLQAAFKKILAWRMFPEYGLLLTHVPVHPETLDVNKCPTNVHGHIHQRHVMTEDFLTRDYRYVCVSVEHTRYRPIHIDELKNL